jgi:putative N6-adenine-specific DNA methylase
VANPPYDERQKAPDVVELYRHLGDVLKHRWAGYTAFIFTGNLDAAKFIGLRPRERIRLFNGPIECRLLKFPIYALGPPTAG